MRQPITDLVDQRFGFLITPLACVSVDPTEKQLIVHVEADDGTIDPTATKEDRKALESSGKYRWAAGGCAFVLALKDARVLVTIFRDGGAPSYALHNTLSSGLSTCVEELVDPTLVAMREGYEEIQVFLKNGMRLAPELGQGSWPANERYLPANVPSHDITPEKSIWNITVDCSTLSPTLVERRALVNLDKQTGGIDLLYVIEMDLRLYNLSEIYIKDGELDGKLDRIIELFELEDNGTLGDIVVAYKSGKPITPEPRDEYRFTPVLQEVVTALAL
jgi:hypothetical protein